MILLYDSLSIELVLNAVDHAMEKCCPDWSDSLRSWIKNLIELSCQSGVVKSNIEWFVSKIGIPTGGVACVDIGNIALHFVLDQIVYQEHARPSQLVSLLRYVDDGLGFWKDTKEYLRKLSEEDVH